VASHRNAQSVQIIEPNVFDSPGFPISQDNRFANKFGLCFMRRGKDGGCLLFSGRMELRLATGHLRLGFLVSICACPVKKTPWAVGLTKAVAGLGIDR
jgi:hypothetical protein